MWDQWASSMSIEKPAQPVKKKRLGKTVKTWEGHHHIIECDIMHSHEQPSGAVVSDYYGKLDQLTAENCPNRRFVLSSFLLHISQWLPQTRSRSRQRRAPSTRSVLAAFKGLYCAISWLLGTTSGRIRLTELQFCVGIGRDSGVHHPPAQACVRQVSPGLEFF